jgi:pimeloyl-ACP methyl ester carboxylesterase
MDDLHAVLDAAEAECPAIFGISEGGPMSILFAATYPERVQSLVLYGTLPRFSPEPPDYPWGFTAEQTAAVRDEIETRWGDGAMARLPRSLRKGSTGFSEPHDGPDALEGAVNH